MRCPAADLLSESCDFLRHALLAVQELFSDYVTDLDHSWLTLSSLSVSPRQAVSPSGQGRSESPVYTNLQELKITQTNQPPLPSSSPLSVQGEWETHKDQNGRHFYYNRSTQERTWKPPRVRDGSSGSSRGESHSAGETCEVQTTWCSMGSTSMFQQASLVKSAKYIH